MNRKKPLFIGLSVLTFLIGLPLILNQNWNRFSNKNKLHSASVEITTSNVSVFNEESEFLLQEVITDSVCVIFRFPPNTCECLEPEFSDGLKHTLTKIGENRVIVVIAAKTPKDLRFFRDRTKLTCPIFGTTETLNEVYDMMRNPYACIVFPDLTIGKVVTINPKNINDLIADVKKIIE